MKKISLLVFVIFYTVLINAQSSNTLGQNTITTAVPFLMISPDSRAGGMGDLGVATSPDENSQHWNPAKYAFLDDSPFGVGVSYIPWLRKIVPDISLSYLSGYYKVNRGQYLTGSIRFFSLGVINARGLNAEPLQSFEPNETAVDLGFSTMLGETFSGAMSVRYINSNLTQGVGSTSGTGSQPGRTIAADVAGFYSTDVEISEYASKVNVGLNLSNIGGKVSYVESTQDRDFIPINMRLGAGLEMEIDEYNKIAFYAETNKLMVPTLPEYEDDGVTIISGRDPNVSVPVGIFQSFSDAPGGMAEELREFTLAGGVEYWYSEQFAVRGGYFHEHATKGNRKYFTLGAGLKYQVFKLDFAYMVPTGQNHPLRETLRFTMAFDFQALKSNSDNL